MLKWESWQLAVGSWQREKSRQESALKGSRVEGRGSRDEGRSSLTRKDAKLKGWSKKVETRITLITVINANGAKAPNQKLRHETRISLIDTNGDGERIFMRKPGNHEKQFLISSIPYSTGLFNRRQPIPFYRQYVPMLLLTAMVGEPAKKSLSLLF